MSKEVTRRQDSIRKSGVKNVLISAIVAGSSYFSLTLVARRFGGSSGSDAYFFLLSLTTISISFIGSLLGTVFLPALISLRGTPQDAQRFMSSIFTWCILVASVAAAASWWWYEQFFAMVSRLDTERIAHMHFVLRYFSPILLFGVAAEFFRVVALAIGKFSTSALTTLFQPLILIAAIYLLAGHLHEEALALALLVSKVAALAFLLGAVIWKSGLSVGFNLSSNKHTFRFVKASGPYWSASIITNVANFYFDYVASGLGSGVLTSLAYAQRIFALPTTVVLNPILEIARTKFAELQVTGNRHLFAVYYGNLLRISLYFSIPVAVMYFCFANNIISAMFERGAFTADLASLSASCLKVYAISIPFSCIFLVNGRACESYQRLLWPSIFGTLGNLLMIGFTLQFVGHAGYIGIPLSRLAIDSLYFLPFGFIAFMRFGGEPNFRLVARTVMTAGIASLTPIAVVAGLNLSEPIYGQRTSLIILGQVVAGFLGSYALVLTLVDRHVGDEFKSLFRRGNGEPR
jgi:putative peptidoglycan lipid II flippase